MEPLHILLIEPNRHARDLLRLLVEAAYPGVIVTPAGTAADGIKMLLERQYDIVIFDDSHAAASLKELCGEADCQLVLMRQDTRLKPSDIQPLHPNIPSQNLLYKPIMFSDLCQMLHQAVLNSWSRQARTSGRRRERTLPDHWN